MQTMTTETPTIGAADGTCHRCGGPIAILTKVYAIHRGGKRWSRVACPHCARGTRVTVEGHVYVVLKGAAGGGARR